MSISPPTDIILDVARAADPQRLQAATRKLARQADNAGATDFAALVDRAALQATRARPSVKSADAAARTAAKPAGTSAPASPTEAAYQALGGILLQKTFESAMPHGSDSLFGKGAAGAMWKSMLAQQMASGVSASIFKLPKTDPAHADDHASTAKPLAAKAGALT